MKMEFSKDFRKILKYKFSFQWEASFSMRTDGQTDMTKPIVAIRHFAIMPTNCNAPVQT